MKSEIKFQELKSVMAPQSCEVDMPAVVQLGRGTITRRNSVEYPLYGLGIVVLVENYKTPPGWYAFSDLNGSVGEILAPGISPARSVLSRGELRLVILDLAIKNYPVKNSQTKAPL